MEGFEVAQITNEEVWEDVFGAPASRFVLVLRPKGGHAKRCNPFVAVVDKVNDLSVHRVRHLPIGQRDTWLVVPRARVQCPQCGPTVEAVPWLDRYQRVTTCLAEKIARLAQVLPIKRVAAWIGVGWDTVKQLTIGAPQPPNWARRRIIWRESGGSRSTNSRSGRGSNTQRSCSISTANASSRAGAIGKPCAAF